MIHARTLTCNLKVGGEGEGGAEGGFHRENCFIFRYMNKRHFKIDISRLTITQLCAVFIYIHTYNSQRPPF